MAETTSGLTKKDLEQIQKDIKKVKDFIKLIEEMGGEVPAPLKKVLDRLELAIKVGKGIGEAAEEASFALKKYEADLMTACKTVDDEMQAVCEAEVTRKWQARSVNFVLSYKNPDSVTSRSIQKAVKSLMPEMICKRWDYCAKNDKQK